MMTTGFLPRQADITDHTANASARSEYSMTFLPYFVQLIEEPLVVRNVAELARMIAVLFQRPVWRRGHYEMHGLVGYPAQVTGVPEAREVAGQVIRRRPWD